MTRAALVLVSDAIRLDGDIARISLSKGYEAIVDLSDVKYLSHKKWSALTSARRKAVYACSVTSFQGKQVMALMHRMIIGAKP